MNWLPDTTQTSAHSSSTSVSACANNGVAERSPEAFFFKHEKDTATNLPLRHQKEMRCLQINPPPYTYIVLGATHPLYEYNTL